MFVLPFSDNVVHLNNKKTVENKDADGTSPLDKALIFFPAPSLGEERRVLSLRNTFCSISKIREKSLDLMFF